MAPFNLSDLAVKEIKIAPKDLAPAPEKNYTAKFLAAHFIDFWAIFWTTTLSVSFFQSSLDTFLTTEKLREASDIMDLSAASFFAFGAFTFTYFFFSYYFNAGQTWGMQLTKTRISMRTHDERSALRWAVYSLSLFFTLGLSFQKGKSLLSSWGKMTEHDHLWHELVAQKEMAAPDVMTLIAEEKETEFAEAA